MTHPDDAVRRLLADARHDEPVPDDVAARLDDTLAALVAERASSPSPSAEAVAPVAEVVDLAARRRRRVTQFVAAAAVVVVAGVGIDQMQPFSGQKADNAATSLDSTRPQTQRELSESPRGAAKNKADDDAHLDLDSSESLAGGDALNGGAPRLGPGMDDDELLGAMITGSEAEDFHRSTAAARCSAALNGRWASVWWDDEAAFARFLPQDDPERLEVRLCDGTVVRVVPLD